MNDGPGWRVRRTLPRIDFFVESRMNVWLEPMMEILKPVDMSKLEIRPVIRVEYDLLWRLAINNVFSWNVYEYMTYDMQMSSACDCIFVAICR